MPKKRSVQQGVGGVVGCLSKYVVLSSRLQLLNQFVSISGHEFLQVMRPDAEEKTKHKVGFAICNCSKVFW